MAAQSQYYWFFHMDSAPCNTAKKTQLYGKEKIKTIDNKPYSPDLAPVDSFRLPKAKKTLGGMRIMATTWSSMPWTGS